MSGQSKPDQKVGFAPSRLAAIEQDIGCAVIGLTLRTPDRRFVWIDQRNPARIASDEQFVQLGAL